MIVFFRDFHLSTALLLIAARKDIKLFCNSKVLYKIFSYFSSAVVSLSAEELLLFSFSCKAENSASSPNVVFSALVFNTLATLAAALQEKLKSNNSSADNETTAEEK